MNSDLFGAPVQQERKPWFSPSRLKTFIQCPKKYHFQNVLKLPTQPSPILDLGSNVHAALRDWLRLKPSARTQDNLVEFYRNAWRGNRPAFVNRSREELREWGERGKQMLFRYVETLEPDLEPILTERNVTADYGDVSVGGRVDRVDALPDGTLRVVDYKTGKFPKKPQLTKDEDLAAPVYARAVSAHYAGTPVKDIELHFLETGEKLVFEVDEIWQMHKDLAVVEAAHAARDAEKSNTFPAQTSVLCRWCDFKNRCDEGKAFLDASPDPH